MKRALSILALLLCASPAFCDGFLGLNPPPNNTNAPAITPDPPKKSTNAPTPRPAPAPSFSDLVNWAVTTGKPAPVSAALANALELGSEKLTMLQRGFFQGTNTLNQIHRAIQVNPGNGTVLMGYREPARQILWITTPSGIVIRTYDYEAGAYKSISNTQYVELYFETQNFLIKQMTLTPNDHPSTP